jgi:tRNA (guanine-N7-)-methyltransferase
VSAPVEVAVGGRIGPPPEPGASGFLDRLLPGDGAWEVELGFGKGRFLLARAAARPERRFLGIEVAGEYFRLAARRARSRGLGNVALLHGEALYLLAAVLPRGFATELHVYFPDPWPKSRHQRRRLFSPGSVDLVLGALVPGGRLWFATDFLDYGAEVEEILRSHPALEVERVEPGWPEGPRTNYEAKYVAEGRPILRLAAVLAGAPDPHPRGEAALLAAVAAGAETGDGG